MQYYQNVEISITEQTTFKAHRKNIPIANRSMSCSSKEGNMIRCKIFKKNPSLYCMLSLTGKQFLQFLSFYKYRGQNISSEKRKLSFYKSNQWPFQPCSSNHRTIWHNITITLCGPPRITSTWSLCMPLLFFDSCFRKMLISLPRRLIAICNFILHTFKEHKPYKILKIIF